MSIRSAVCLYGIVGGVEGKSGSGGNIPVEECCNAYNRHIIDVNNADVFIHSWSVEEEAILASLYKPKKYKFQEQIQFDYKISDKDMNLVARSKNQEKNRASIRDHKKKGFNALSKWYSVKSVIELKQEYERKYNFKYDCVMLTRFDTLFFKNLDFSKLNLNYLWLPHFNKFNGWAGDLSITPDKSNATLTRNAFSDMWYFSNSDIINTFTKIYKGVDVGNYRISQHKAGWDHMAALGYNRSNFKYILYRHYDFELYRWRLGNLYLKGDLDASKR